MSSGTPSVLCVAGEPGRRDRLAAELAGSFDDPTVETVPSAAAAAWAVDGSRPRVDCVVSAYRLPDADGIDLLRTVREREGALPFVLFVREGSEAVASEAVSAGVTEYVRAAEPDPCERIAAGAREAVRRGRSDGAAAAGGRSGREAGRYEFLVESAADAMAVLEGGRYRLVNGACVDLLGRPEREILGSTDAALLPGSTAASLREHAERATATGERVDHRVELAASGEDRTVEVVHVPHGRGADGDRIARIYRDVTEQVERERLLREERDRLEGLASAVAHDARNAVQIIEGRTDLAVDLLPADAVEARRNLEAARRGVDRVGDLVTSLESLRGLNEPVSAAEPVEIGSVAREAWRTVEAPDATLRVAGDPVVDGDRRRICTLLENLLRNAVDHGGPDVTVVVDALPDGPGFAVDDDGPGIPPAERERVRDLGYASGGGTGLGLGIVAGIADAHGWELSIGDSEANGARFEFRPETIDSLVS
ncbi:hypothetical protein BRC97_01805 [Halobacteriales archaeon QS_6_71_20]|nr:MAG: hypothetical protein BRC97_01805 [Halobacteriales archaeon QS_6_71_20]